MTVAGAVDAGGQVLGSHCQRPHSGHASSAMRAVSRARISATVRGTRR
ncbi:hypothetical protein ACFWII_37360 [Streptomyces sp. NPDC127063]